MGCFLGCFGKDRRRRKQSKTPSPGGQQRHRGQNYLQIQTVVPTEEDIRSSPPANLITDLCDGKPEEPLSSNSKKKVTFDSNVTTYEHVSVVESFDSLLAPESKEKKGSGLVLPSDSQSRSEDDSVSSSVGSYPPNHRYENCRDSDDEDMDCGYSDEEGYSDEDEEQWPQSALTDSMESRTDDVEDQPILEEVESPVELPLRPYQDVKNIGPNEYARNRNDYVHQVLNPVANLSQWKAVKSKGSSQFNPEKENSKTDLKAPPILPFSSEPTFKPKSEGKKNSNQEIAVDASLSTWLTDNRSSPVKTTSHGSLETVSYDKVRTFEDRPILGALTVEELKQQRSATSSPRKSPSRSPDDMIIIGSVGTYWNNSESSKDSRSGSSFKGIPNTTSKYREDKRVNWHSTPFEARLERALKGNAGGV